MLLLMETIVNRTYVKHEKTIYLPLFTNSIRSYLLWSPVIVLRGAIVNRTCGIRKNLPVYIYPFILTVFGPVNYGTP